MHKNRRAGLSFVVAMFIAANVVCAFPLAAQASLYSPGATLNPDCAPTDSAATCGIVTSVASGTANSVPYYASDGTLLSATSSMTILQSGSFGFGTSEPTYKLDVAGNGHFTSFVDAAKFIATSSSATSIFNGNLQVVGNTTLAPSLSGLLGLNSGVTYAVSTSTLNIGGNAGTVTNGVYTTDTGTVTNAMLAGSISALKLVGTDISTLGTIISGTWHGSAIEDSYISSSAIWNAKQAALSFVYPLTNIANTIGLSFGTTTANSWSALQEFNGNASTTQLTATGSVYLATTGGSVGIGTTSPAGMLDIYGTNNALRLSYDGTNYSSFTTAGDGSTTIFTNGTNPNLNINLNGGGDLDVSNGAFYFNSGLRSLAINNNSSGAQFEVAVPSGVQGDAVPTMTNYSVPSGTVSENSALNAGWRAFDNATTTGSYWESSSVGYGWLAYEFPTSKTITKYTLTSYGASYAPKNWTFEGWTGSEWVVLDTKTNITGWSAHLKREYTISNTTAYTKYRINISSINGSSHVILEEMEMMESSIYQTAFNVATTGNSGIGTSSPFANLSIHANSSSTNTTLFAIASSTAAATTTLFSVSNRGDVTINGSSGSTCTLGDGTGGTSCTSDERLKTNIALIVDPLEGIEQLRGVTFNWADQTKDQSQFIGVIAQDVQKVFPQAVSTTASGYLSVDYGALVAPLIGAVQELAEQVSSLAATVAGFGQSFTTQRLCVQKSDGSDVCVTGDQLQQILQNSSVSPVNGASDTAEPSQNDTVDVGGDTESEVSSGASEPDATDEMRVDSVASSDSAE